MKKDAERMDPTVSKKKTNAHTGEAKPKRSRASTKAVVSDAAQ